MTFPRAITKGEKKKKKARIDKIAFGSGQGPRWSLEGLGDRESGRVIWRFRGAIRVLDGHKKI